MLDVLKFVQGSVAKKEIIATLTHFVISAGTIRGFNGVMAISSPIALNLDCKPKALTFIKAIGSCEETVQLSLTAAGRLAIKSGKFKAFVDCVEGETPHVMPEGDIVTIDGNELMKALKLMEPFMGDDASRPWSNGILLKGQSAYATNNVSLVEYWLGAVFPQPTCIPRMAVKELLRIGEAPAYTQVAEKSITFHYDGGRWLRTALIDNAWPDLEKILNNPSQPQPVDPEIFKALATVKPMVDKSDRVIFKEGMLLTSLDETEGAVYELPGCPIDATYGHAQVSALNGVATSIDWDTHPVLFFGERLRGAIIERRM